MLKLIIIIFLIAFLACNLNNNSVERWAISPSSVRIDSILFVKCKNNPCKLNPKKDIIFNYLKNTFTNITYSISSSTVSGGMIYFYAKNSAGTKGNIYITYNGIYSNTNIVNFLKNHSVKPQSTISIKFKNNDVSNNIQNKFNDFKDFIKNSGRSRSILMNQNLGGSVYVQVIMQLENNGTLYYSVNDSQSNFKDDIPKLMLLITKFKSSIYSN
jgi:hypothetical protein